MKNNYFIFILLLVVFSSCNSNNHLHKVAVKKTGSDTTLVQQHRPDSLIDNIQVNENIELNQFDTNYTVAFEELKAMLEDRQPLSFKRAVFIVENTYLDSTLNYSKYCEQIDYLAFIAKLWSNVNKLENYNYSDSTNTLLNAAIFHTLTDTVFSTDRDIINFPYVYDFNDCFAKEDRTNMFVTKLLRTHKGNCHSLPFLYKIIAEELNAKAWLSLIPNHIYLRNWCKKTGWYNTEMTSAMFPNEGWVMASGYVSTKSIVSGIYMDTLGLKQSIVVCLNDLAKSYLRKFDSPDLQFVLKCCDLGLKYYPNYATLLLLKAETHTKIYRAYAEKYGLNAQKPVDTYTKIGRYHRAEMEKSYALLAKYDYRSIPEATFLEWILTLENNKEKYQDTKINNIFKTE